MSAGHRRWSKLQSTIEANFAAALEGRLRVRCVGYRDAHDADGRAYFEFDGEEIGNFCNLTAQFHAGGRHNPQCHDTAMPLSWSSPSLPGPNSSVPHLKGEYSQNDFLASCLSYRDLSINAALASTNPLHLALAVVDRRCGQRRLDTLKGQELPPIAARLLQIRLSAKKQ